MIWPFTELERLKQHNVMLMDAQTAVQIEAADLRAELREQKEATAKYSAQADRLVSALRETTDERAAFHEERDALAGEVAALKKSSIPEGEFKVCDCGCHSFITQGHLIGWKDGDHGKVPVPLGGMVMCANPNCKTLWRMDDQGMQRVKFDKQVPPDGKRRKPNDDGDLAWEPGRR